MRRKLSVLELELTKMPTNNKAASQITFLESLKRKTNVAAAKKMGWRIVKIITKEGEYIPSSSSDVFLIMTKRNKTPRKTKIK